MSQNTPDYSEDLFGNISSAICAYSFQTCADKPTTFTHSWPECQNPYWIVSEDDESKTLSLKEFYADLGRFGPKDTFRVHFKAYFFRDEWDDLDPD